MTIEYPYTLAQLARILSALENERRNPNTKRNAIRAIERAASQLGLDSDDIFDAADGLLSGRIDAATWRASLGNSRPADGTGEAAADDAGPAPDVPEPAAEPVADDRGDEPTEPLPMPNAGTVRATSQCRPGTRPNTKLARMIAMLKRPEGATIAQIAEAMGWQRHTVRGAISGALRKKLGLTITSGKIEGRGTVYYLED